MTSYTRLANRVQQVLLALTALAFSLTLGWIDQEIGTHVSLWVFHLLPITAVSWFVGRRSGLAFAVLTALLTANALLRVEAAGLPFWPAAWSAVCFAVLYVLTSLATNRVETHLHDQAQLARVDLLTRVPNLLSFTEQLPDHLESVGRGLPVTLALFDLDGIAYVNERFGTKAGDLLLRTTADTLRSTTPNDALVGRVGGTTFAVVLPRTNEEAATFALEDAREKVLRQINLYDRPVSVAVAGVSTQSPSRDGQGLMDRAGWLLQSLKLERALHPFRVIGDEEG